MVVMLAEWVFTSAFLILVVLALRAALGKRVSARLRYALWAAVLVRLLVPVQLFTSPLAGTRIFSESRVEQNVVDFPSAPIVPNAPDNVLSLNGQGSQTANFITAPQAPNPPTLPDVPEPPAAPDLRSAPAWLGWAWLAGSAAVTLVLLVSNLRFYWKLRRERIPMENADCPLRVYAAVNLPSPCLFGILRPAVYVTPEAAADPDMLRHVLAHEYTHYRQGDHLWSLLRCGALAAHWWNPLVWLTAVLSQRDAELACDEGALKRLGDGERAGYGGTLLTLVTAKPRPADLLRCATTMAGDKKSLKERISRIAKAPKRVIWAVVVAVLVTVLACACAFGQEAEPEEADEPEPDATPSLAAGSDLDLDFAWDGWELRNTETLATAPDLNRNGIPETVVVGDVCSPEDVESYSYGTGVGIIEGDELLWMGWGSNIHAGENSFLLYDQGGEDYLMEFNIHGQMGHAHGDYRIFTLENGEETTVRESHVQFDYCTDSLASVKDNFDPEAVAAFVDEVDGLLEHCTLLVDTGYNYRGNPPEQVDLRWLENYAVGYSWLDSQTTLENLVRFKLAAEHPVYTRDLNGDMLTETVQITQDGGCLRVELWDNNGNVIWSDEGYFAHAGYNAVFLCTLNDKDYLLRYHPYMGQGWCTYSYELFTLTRDGKEKMVRENSVEFDINFDTPMHESFDPEAIAAFMDEINGLLANSVQLINTDEDLLSAFEKNGRLYDDLWWLDAWKPVFVRDDGKTLVENLRNFKKAMEKLGYAEEPEVRSIDEQNRHFRLTYQDKSVEFGGPEGQYQYGMDPQVMDLNGDGRNEIVFTATGDHSNGYRQENLYIFDAETLERYEPYDIVGQVYHLIQCTGDEENFYLSAPGMERVTIPKSIVQDDPWEEHLVFDTLEFGYCWYFDVDTGHNTISLLMWGYGSTGVKFCAGIKAELKLTQTGVEPGRFEFLPDPTGAVFYTKDLYAR